MVFGKVKPSGAHSSLQQTEAVMVAMFCVGLTSLQLGGLESKRARLFSFLASTGFQSGHAKGNP